MFGAVDYVSYGNIQQGESLKVIFRPAEQQDCPAPDDDPQTSQHPAMPKPLSITCCRRKVRRRSLDAWLDAPRRDVAAKRPLLDALKVLPTTSEGSSEGAPARPLQSAVRAVIDPVSPALAAGGPQLQEPVVKQTFLSGATLAALVTLVALPLFILLQAIFPI